MRGQGMHSNSQHTQDGLNFVDADGDGNCDNLGSNLGQRTGMGRR